MDWSVWGSCSATCVAGQMTRQRQCLNPRPEHGGRNCTGNSLEHKTCHPGQCTGITHAYLKIRRALYTYCVKFVHKSIDYDFNVHTKKKEDLHIPIMVHAIGS